jgi:hypothetical protein
MMARSDYEYDGGADASNYNTVSFTDRVRDFVRIKLYLTKGKRALISSFSSIYMYIHRPST